MHACKRTKRAVVRARLHSLGWQPKHAAAFEECKQAILHRTTLWNRNENMRLCIFTDASDSHWSGIVTQVPRDQLTLPHIDQTHDTLAFHSDRFSTIQLGWSTIEKEAYAVMDSIERYH